MRENQRLHDDIRSPGRFLLPSLAISLFATRPPVILTRLLLIDIGITFRYSVGIMGQIHTAAASISAISAVFMGIVSVRFNHKSLLITGLLFVNISALGCIIASNFKMMLFFHSLSGLGWAMVAPMVYTLIAAHLPLYRRARAIGWLLSGEALAATVGTPIIGIIAEAGGWRLAYLGFVLPIALISLVLAAKEVPSSPKNPNSPRNHGHSLEGFKEVFTNNSAIACLVGAALSWAGWQTFVLYGLSFFRERFLLSIWITSILVIPSSLCFILGSQFSGRIVPRFGGKPVIVLTAFVAGIFIIFFTNAPNLWLALAFRFLGSMITGMLFTAVRSLALEQIQSFRGTMMSLNSAADNMGVALGAGVGGLILFWFDYKGLGLALGAMSITAALLFYLMVIDPTRKDSL